MKLKVGFSVIILLLISALSTYAQVVDPDPCGPTDIDSGNCPLDTWVIILVAVVSIFAAFRLYNRKKSAVQTIR